MLVIVGHKIVNNMAFAKYRERRGFELENSPHPNALIVTSPLKDSRK
jgi:hypothetical protein